MKEKMEKLIELLDNINLDLYCKKYEKEEWEDDPPYSKYISTDNPTSDEIEELSCNCFIKGGKPDYEAIHEFKTACNKRYVVEKGESDSFGWLTGIIRRLEDDICMTVFG